MAKFLTLSLNRRAPRQDVTRPTGPLSSADVTPFVVTWFRFRHTRGGRRLCSCWICDDSDLRTRP